MKALSLTQPWATLVAIGAKKIETRSWRTNYRGPLAIHAALGFPLDAKILCRHSAFRGALESAGYSVGVGRLGANLPRGRILAIATLKDVVSTDHYQPPLGSDERSFGDYSPRRWAWILEDVRRLEGLYYARGRLGLFDVELEQDAR